MRHQNNQELSKKIQKEQFDVKNKNVRKIQQTGVVINPTFSSEKAKEKQLRQKSQQTKQLSQSHLQYFNIIKAQKYLKKPLFSSDRKLLQASLYFMDIIERNQMYNFPCILFSFACMITLTEFRVLQGFWASSDMQNHFDFLFKKVKQNGEKQLNQDFFNETLLIFLRIDNLTIEKLLEYASKLLRQNRAIMLGQYPYYYNMFAFLINKHSVFAGRHVQTIQYSIEHIHTKQFNSNFQLQDLFFELGSLQEALVRTYTSQDV